MIYKIPLFSFFVFFVSFIRLRYVRDVSWYDDPTYDACINLNQQTTCFITNMVTHITVDFSNYDLYKNIPLNTIIDNYNTVISPIENREKLYPIFNPPVTGKVKCFWDGITAPYLTLPCLPFLIQINLFIVVISLFSWVFSTLLYLDLSIS